MPQYESTFIIRQDLSKADVEKLMGSYSDVIEKDGGTIVKSEYWGLRSLAYRVKKYRRAHYNMLAINASDAAMKEVERLARYNEEVLRNVTIRVDSIDKEPSALIRTERDDEPKEI